ncbi:nitrate reductase molybdenum cofactor assembly chaperone [Virgibacillus sp. MSP4-1]|uniref:nitrate reductase molybdenum cofactor assembly chaperone n=1 Tax=Virgibacillus sp. MSP4-1 TaxID=2700081 RepID=UPI0003A884D8|nr:nitrate reductase molybdenum cofactor assembly chaperone [Virgibacillus sp. MSP4-1]QHS22495.1 nitrate reductase molybdenum cofactor assembly chaperone [Virgibacillus sp. MSP4-1]
MKQPVYQMIAFLFHYPSQEMIDEISTLQQDIKQISNTSTQQNLLTFTDHVKEQSLEEWKSHYIENFDFSRTINLYVTYLKLGEQRERGLELLKLKKFYEAHGFSVSDQELPDYLPLMLEFCANSDIEVSNELLEMNLKGIHEIQKRLIETNSSYQYLMKALFRQMEENGLDIHLKEEAKPGQEKLYYS